MDTPRDNTVVYENSDNSTTTFTASAMSWGAILGGAVAAAAISLILFILGIGLGLTSISPWSQEGIRAGTLGISTILWITFTSLAAAALGGYLTGRLRTRWVSVHNDEIFFRDTAHGFLAWAVATLLTATLFTSLMTSLVSGGAAVASGVGNAAMTAASTATGGAAVAAGDEDNDAGSLGYFVDSLFRRQPGAANPADAQTNNTPADTISPQAGNQQDNNDQTVNRQNDNIAQAANAGADNVRTSNDQIMQDPQIIVAEVSRIFMRTFRNEGTLPQNDLDYIAAQVSSYANISQSEAETRVREVFDSIRMEMQELETTTRNAAEEARETAAQVSLWFFISLLIGAFVGSFSATIGGRQRDI